MQKLHDLTNSIINNLFLLKNLLTKVRQKGRYKLLLGGEHHWDYHGLVLSGQDQAEFVREYFSEPFEKARTQDPDDQEIALICSGCKYLLSELLNDADEEKTRILMAQQELMEKQTAELWKARKGLK